eukprot:gene52350-63993_t
METGMSTLIDAGRVVDPETLRAGFLSTVQDVLAQATLTRPDEAWMHKGGRSGPHFSGSNLVTATAPTGAADADALRGEVWRVAGAVCDPEIPVLSIADLGVLRDETIADGAIEGAI